MDCQKTTLIFQEALSLFCFVHLIYFLGTKKETSGKSTDLHEHRNMIHYAFTRRYSSKQNIRTKFIHSHILLLPLQVIHSQCTNGSRMEYHSEIRIIHSTKLTMLPGKMQEVINVLRKTMQVPYSAKRLMSLLSVSILDIYPFASIVCSIISLGYCFPSVILAPF